MPPLAPVLPATHNVVVNLKQILTNIQRAVTYIPAAVDASYRPPAPSPEEKDMCRIGTLEALQVLLQPALDSSGVKYFKKLHKGNWVHILQYESSAQGMQHILLKPTTIQNTLTNTECKIEPSLAYYMGVALDFSPLSPAPNATFAAMAGYIRCFGTGAMDCPHFMSFAPPVDPTPPKAVAAPEPAPTMPPAAMKQLVKDDLLGFFAFFRLSNQDVPEKLQFLYRRKATERGSRLAEVIRQNSPNDAVHAKHVSNLIAQQEKLEPISPSEVTKRVLEHTTELVKQFFDVLFQSPTWQSQYRHFRKDLRNAGCTETEGANKGVLHVNCPEHKLQFDIIKTTPKNLASQSGTR